ncbi:MAG TPA: polyphosphate kinase [Rhodobacteraceae bacterium]|nr:polyphosphate kinase [Paracoccaceae bacterium]
MLELDHLAVAGETLEEAAAAVEAALGVAMQAGGRHARFGTHNRLLGLADGLYLEAIAIDPEAPAPDRPRWFDLDRFSGPARLHNWICRARDLDAALARLGPGAGAPVALERGALRWRMAVPADGRLAHDECHPAVMQWDCAAHPADMLPASGCALHRLVVVHPEAHALRELLAPLLTDPRVAFEAGAPALMAEIDTPHGRRALR